MGSNQLRLLKFAMRYPNSWHTCGPDSRRAMRELEAKGLLQVSRTSSANGPQFKLALGNGFPVVYRVIFGEGE